MLVIVTHAHAAACSVCYLTAVASIILFFL